jgi:hypothetical protein
LLKFDGHEARYVHYAAGGRGGILRSLRKGDLDAMMGVWADDGDTSACIPAANA